MTVHNNYMEPCTHKIYKYIHRVTVSIWNLKESRFETQCDESQIVTYGTYSVEHKLYKVFILHLLKLHNEVQNFL